MSPNDVFIAAPVRTPFGRFGGALASLTAPELGAIAARATVERAGLKPADIPLTIMGNARPAGVGPNPARQIAHRAGFPDSGVAYTINMACGSGLRSVINAWQSVRTGEADVVVAGGVEAMSRVPYLLEGVRWGVKMGNQQVTDAMYRDGFLCPLCGQLMGETAETLASKYDISRREQDEFSARSQQRCEAARKAGRFDDEIVPVAVKDARGRESVLTRDEHPRDGVTAESLATLPPVFRKDGTVHAGSSSGIVDGAAAMIVLSGAAAKRLKVQPAARLVDVACAGVDPAIMGVGPVPAVRALMERTGLAIGDFDLIELNEAFAAQVIACQRELKFDLERVNVLGGAIAIGHPIGATGARITVTLVHEMLRRRARRGLSTLCISGGLGIALLLENARL
ncbi:MAG TPA: acetyl-CoA C-acetyltransferase [Candidatus Polarisedimenticolia bacterium]|jgi:acetyl-CoA C-acetyltransferase|nr:acetyl-CoA C-acetyltransferase [Candidatus Polarisedimenticolia bacterium]